MEFSWEALVTIFGLLIIWGTSLVSLWIRINVKIKEIEIKIENIFMRQDTQSRAIEKVFDSTKQEIDSCLHRVEVRIDHTEKINREDHLLIAKKLDEMKDIILKK